MAKGRKVTILGAGNVGATTAYALAVQGIASEIVLVDIFKEKAIGEADDIVQGAPFLAPFKIYAGDYDAAKDSDIVVFTLGKPRQPGMTRIDLVNSNVALFKADVVPPIVKNAPDAVYVVVSNPVDILTYAVTKLSGLPPTRIVGSGTLLDTSRLRAILSERWNVCCSNIDAYVLGEHGDTSFIPWSLSSIFGVNAVTYAETYAGEKKPDWKDEVLTDVREAGARVIKNKRATFFAIALSVCEICKNILNDTNKILPVGSVLDGQYGIDGVCVSLPLAVGAQGISRGLLPKLAPAEEEALHKSAEAIKPFFEGI